MNEEIKTTVVDAGTTDESSERYINSVHREGTVWNLVVMAILLLFPVTVGIIFQAVPDFAALGAGLLAAYSYVVRLFGQVLKRVAYLVYGSVGVRCKQYVALSVEHKLAHHTAEGLRGLSCSRRSYEQKKVVGLLGFEYNVVYVVVAVVAGERTLLVELRLTAREQQVDAFLRGGEKAVEVAQ